ncbi:alcohol dehydrogenase class-3 chain L-like [Bradysia coprophila]|uniref:alcohol dehydrogenase class-3 chain L-like n=1 Tax=Bradysia coprophila TaxID=38358 RepID=UPI00187D7201|nr:alcohol dehydrogenase class-3 chain L-like [Bradysia coprophila]
MTEGKVITCKAAVLWEKGAPFVIEEIQVQPPGRNEVRVKMIASGICHTDESVVKGYFDGVKYPVIGGHEGAGIVESVGDDVVGFKSGDHVIPLGVPQCGQCRVCKHPEANICSKFIDTMYCEGRDVRPKCFSCRGQEVTGGMSTFTEYCVVNQIELCKIDSTAPLDEVCLFGCAISTGYGAALNTAKVQPGSTCAVWGLGAIGLAIVMGCKKAGASRIIAIDINTRKFTVARELGATDFVNPKDVTDLTAHLLKMTDGGADYTFEAIGTNATMRQAFETSCLGSGVCVFVGVPASGIEFPLIPFQLLLGRTLKGTIFGDYKPKDHLPKLVEEYLDGGIAIDKFITHRLPFEKINEGFDLLRKGECIRTVLQIATE